MEDLSKRNITILSTRQCIQLVTASTSSTSQKHISSENTAAERLKGVINKQAGYKAPTTLKKADILLRYVRKGVSTLSETLCTLAIHIQERGLRMLVRMENLF